MGSLVAALASLPGLTMPSPQADDICNLHRQKPNLSQKEIASWLGVSVHAVRRALKQERARECEEQRPPAEMQLDTEASQAPRVETTTPWGVSQVPYKGVNRGNKGLYRV